MQTITTHSGLNTIDLVTKSGLELWTIIQHMTQLEMYGLIIEDSPGIYISTQSIAN
jgi:predicted transcriptional regulator